MSVRDVRHLGEIPEGLKEEDNFLKEMGRMRVMGCSQGTPWFREGGRGSRTTIRHNSRRETCRLTHKACEARYGE